MAVYLDGGIPARIALGNVAKLGGATALTVAVTWKPTETPVTYRRLITQSDTNPNWWNHAFTVSTHNTTDEILFAVADGQNHWFSYLTTALNLAVGTTYRLIARWTPDTMAIWANGSEQTLTNIHTGTVAKLGTSASSCDIGTENSTGTAAQTGDYSEVVLWTRALSDAEMLAYSNGVSPEYLRGTDGVLYVPCYSVTTLTDRWGSYHGTNYSGVNATHPTVTLAAHTSADRYVYW